MKKLIVAGSRDFRDYELLKGVLDEYLNGEDVDIVSGGAVGTDFLGERYAKEILKRMPRIEEADWDRYGFSAGPRRNARMASYADECICFWDNKVHRSGTGNMILEALKNNLSLMIIDYISGRKIEISYSTL